MEWEKHRASDTYAITGTSNADARNATGAENRKWVHWSAITTVTETSLMTDESLIVFGHR